MLWSRIVSQRSPFPGYNMYASRLKNARRTEDLMCFITCLQEANRYVCLSQPVNIATDESVNDCVCLMILE